MRTAVFAVAAVFAAACGGSRDDVASSDREPATIETVRIALFNVRELSTAKLLAGGEEAPGEDPQLIAAAAILARVRPDILVLQEIDHDYGAEERGLDLNARRFARRYLAAAQPPLEMPWAFAAPCNTGLLAGLDLDGDGRTATEEDRGGRVYGGDSFGFGTYPGQYAMAVLSRFELLEGEARTFRRFLWRDLPGHHMPPDFYSPEARAVLRLSSKSHWDLPVAIGDRRLHLLVSHPTPPGFDGEEDRNGRRNFDEIKLWAHYLDGSEALVDDTGRRGGYGQDAPFVLIGDLNARPGAEAPRYEGMAAIDQLLAHPRILESGPWLTSGGALAAAGEGASPGPPDFPERATAVFFDGIRIDYILPSRELEIVDGGVFWPSPAEDPEGAELAERASDHRLLWLDVRLPPD